MKSTVPACRALGVLAVSMVAVLGASAPAPLDASAATAAEPEATSLLGRSLTRPELPAQVIERHQSAIESLRLRLASHPEDADALVWIGRHLGYLGRYHEAVAFFGDGVERFPDQAARFLRHRGHRKISLRQLDGAVADLRDGVAKMAGQTDAVESDGLPNLYNRPTGTLKTNLWYHLGLAHYLRGDFQRSVEAYTACVALADNADMHVAASYWLYMSLRRLGRDADAASVLDAVPLDALLLENDDYQDLLRLFATGTSVRDADALLARYEPGSVGAVTLSYGVGVWHLLSGRRDAALELFRRVVDGDGWAGFGFIASEAELARQDD
ncbi:MAG: tetratricopeptide repeat protein [Thermoanaerobaculia bacterium]|nr:tetratricopeptide repeat protein [Thermoanaerobaculia bacterium]